MYSYIYLHIFVLFFTIGRESTKVSNAEPAISVLFLPESLSDKPFISNPIRTIHYVVNILVHLKFVSGDEFCF
jgi:hypothetical protein